MVRNNKDSVKKSRKRDQGRVDDDVRQQLCDWYDSDFDYDPYGYIDGDLVDHSVPFLSQPQSNDDDDDDDEVGVDPNLIVDSNTCHSRRELPCLNLGHVISEMAISSAASGGGAPRKRRIEKRQSRTVKASADAVRVPSRRRPVEDDEAYAPRRRRNEKDRTDSGSCRTKKQGGESENSSSPGGVTANFFAGSSKVRILHSKTTRSIAVALKAEEGEEEKEHRSKDDAAATESSRTGTAREAHKTVPIVVSGELVDASSSITSASKVSDAPMALPSTVFVRFGEPSLSDVDNLLDLAAAAVAEKEDPTATAKKTKNATEMTPYPPLDVLRKAAKRAQVCVMDPMDTYDLFLLWFRRSLSNHRQQESQQRGDGSFGGCSSSEGKDSSIDGNDEKVASNRTRCMICLEEEDDPNGAGTTLSGSATMSHCGHYACRDCWASYLRFAAKSGQTVQDVACPADRCPRTLTLFDAAYILFSDHDTDTPTGEHHKDGAEIFSLLVKNEMEQFALKHCQGSFCPSSRCNELLVVDPARAEECASPHRGCNIILCRCGTTLCIECGHQHHLRGHPGISCTAMAEHEKNLSRGKNAAMDYEYIVRHTRPCPRCSYAIEKDAGCNHVRCEKCRYYFCWQCLGPGDFCGAYRCQNTGHISWGKEVGDDEDISIPKYESILSMVRNYRGYRQAEAHYKSLQAELLIRKKGTFASPRAILRQLVAAEQMQLQLAVVWARGYMVEKEATPDRLLSATKKLELLLEISEFRFDVKKRRHSQQSQKYVDEEALARRQVRRITALAGEELDALLVSEMEEYCLANDEQFTRACARAIQAVVEAMLQIKPQPNRNRRQKRCENESMQNMPLNERKERGHEPWKTVHGFCKATLEEEQNETLASFEPKPRWKKGKAKVSMRRSHDLEYSTI